MDKGVYCLVFKNPACTVRVGALGSIAFRAGWHIYAGSALGPGGLARVRRHIRFAEERERRPKWHVDYLLSDPRFSLVYAICAQTTDPLECALAGATGGSFVPGFGCSDCRCASHLFFRPRDPRNVIKKAFQNVGLSPLIKTLINPEVKGNI
jgi:Uri superfamily endonuclease